MDRGSEHRNARSRADDILSRQRAEIRRYEQEEADRIFALQLLESDLSKSKKETTTSSKISTEDDDGGDGGGGPSLSIVKTEKASSHGRRDGTKPKVLRIDLDVLSSLKVEETRKNAKHRQSIDPESLQINRKRKAVIDVDKLENHRPAKKPTSRRFSMSSDTVANRGTDSKATASRSFESDLPSYWTRCPTCTTSASSSAAPKRYHLISLTEGNEEYRRVVQPLMNVGFKPLRVQRIQNAFLYRRLFFERDQMIKSHPTGFDVCEKLLYHTTRTSACDIADEGLDSRLSRDGGNFGNGIYFRLEGEGGAASYILQMEVV